MTSYQHAKTAISGHNYGCSGGPPGTHGLAQRQPREPPLRPGSRERPTSELRLLPPGPHQVHPTTANTPPYEGAPDDRRPHGAEHRRGDPRLTPRLPPRPPRLLTPPIARLKARGRASSRSYPLLHKPQRSPPIKTLPSPQIGMKPNLTRLNTKLETIRARNPYIATRSRVLPHAGFDAR
jgi:hypothetical protein